MSRHTDLTHTARRGPMGCAHTPEQRSASSDRTVGLSCEDARMSENSPEPGGEDRTLDLSESDSLSHSAEVIGIQAVDGFVVPSMALDSADPASDD